MRISKYLGWRVRLGILLVLISIILYSVNYAIFHDSRDLFFYLAIDIAFLPIEVLFVVLVMRVPSANVIRPSFWRSLTWLLEHFSVKLEPI